MRVVQINIFTNKRLLVSEGVCLESAKAIQSKRLKRIYDKNKDDRYIVAIENE